MLSLAASSGALLMELCNAPALVFKKKLKKAHSKAKTRSLLQKSAPYETL